MRVSTAFWGLALAACLTAQEKPFLDTFFEAKAGPKIEQFDAPNGFLVRPVTAGHQPAVLLMAGRAGEEGKAQQWARELASTGFATLAVGSDPDQAVQWLAAQRYVDPQRMAVIAWPETTASAMRLARSRKLAAAVLWGTPIAPEGTTMPVLTVPPSQPADEAWIQVYEFLAQHVEDASSQLARVVDIMRVVNSNEGVRGQLAQSLLQPPASAAQWEQARSRAAIVAEAGNLLLTRHPLKGTPEGWKQKAAEYRDIATALLKAIEARNYPGAKEALREMTQSCAGCHAEYR